MEKESLIEISENDIFENVDETGHHVIQKEVESRQLGCIGSTILIVGSFLLTIGLVIGTTYAFLRSNEVTIHQIITPTATITKNPISPTNIPKTEIPATITLTPIPVFETDTPSPPKVCTVVVTVSDNKTARIRNGPASNSDVVGNVQNQTNLIYFGTDTTGDWASIGQNEWISTSLLSRPICSY